MDDQRDQQQPALHHDVVALGDRIDHPFADAGPREDRLGEDGARHQQPHLQPDGRDHWNQRVAEGVQADDPARRQPLGARRADIVLAEHFQHRRAGLAGDDRQRNGAEHNRRQDQVPDRRNEGAPVAVEQAVEGHEAGDRAQEDAEFHPPRHRRPVQGAGEQDDQQQAPPEDRHRIAGERHPHRQLVEPRTALDCGEDAGRDAEGDGEDQREGRQFEGGGEQRQEVDDHRSLGRQRHPEIALQDLADVIEVLLPDRLVEAELFLEDLVALRRDPVLTGHRQDGIAGQQPDERERGDGDSDHRRHDQRQLLQDVAEHVGEAGRRQMPAATRRVSAIRSRRRCRSGGCPEDPWKSPERACSSA